VQLDKTRIAIRERSHVELLDLTFHLIRTHAGRLTLLLVIGAVPFAVLNAWLIGWMPVTHYEGYFDEDDLMEYARYYCNGALLVFLQAPLATALITLHLGKAVFVPRPTIRSLMEDLRFGWAKLVWCQGFWRLSIPATFSLLLMDRSLEYSPVEVLFLLGGSIWIALLRSVRPFLCEVILLERNPLMSTGTGTMTIGRRMSLLHASGGGEFFSRWLSTCLVALILQFMIYQVILFTQGVFLNDWRHSTPLMLHVAFPLSLWGVAGYMAVYRFLSYLDTRIRNEGWEVDLLLKAEAARLEAHNREEATLVRS
jgi:hypothetical protein